MLTRVGESENVEAVQKDLRANILRTSEESVYSVLRSLSVIKEISVIKDKYVFHHLDERLIKVVLEMEIFSKATRENCLQKLENIFNDTTQRHS